MSRILILLSCATPLVACAGHATSLQISAGAPLMAATLVPQRLILVKRAEIPVPLPSPGQFIKSPDSSGSAARNMPTSRVDAANRAALREPTQNGYLNAVQIYPWTEGSVYRLYAAPEQISDIALQAGETLVSVASGDTVGWIIGDTTSGSDDTKRTHILVKPTASGLKTNLIITTSRRVYYLQLESTTRTAMAVLSWTYPADALLAIMKGNADNEPILPNASRLGLDALNFAYKVSGDKPPWRPLRAFDDGSQVFIEFPASLRQGEAPPLFVTGAQGEEQLVNYRLRGRYYIVDRVFDTAELRIAGKPKNVVRIERERSKH